MLSLTAFVSSDCQSGHADQSVAISAVITLAEVGHRAKGEVTDEAVPILRMVSVVVISPTMFFDLIQTL